MTKQTLAEKLRIVADAIDAGEIQVHILCAATEWDRNIDISTALNWFRSLDSISRIPATIKVGNKIINAPLRVMPKVDEKYWVVKINGRLDALIWQDCDYETAYFNNANCWASEADAKAYAEALLAVRKGEVS